MNWREAIDIAVARTGDDSFRRLCDDDNPDERQRDAFRDTVMAIAGMRKQPGGTPATLKAVPPIMNIDPWLMKIHGCEHFTPGCCHSPAPYCDRFNINPSRDRCIKCLGGEAE